MRKGQSIRYIKTLRKIGQNVLRLRAPTASYLIIPQENSSDKADDKFAGRSAHPATLTVVEAQEAATLVDACARKNITLLKPAHTLGIDAAAIDNFKPLHLAPKEMNLETLRKMIERLV